MLNIKEKNYQRGRVFTKKTLKVMNVKKKPTTKIRTQGNTAGWLAVWLFLSFFLFLLNVCAIHIHIDINIVEFFLSIFFVKLMMGHKG